MPGANRTNWPRGHRCQQAARNRRVSPVSRASCSSTSASNCLFRAGVVNAAAMPLRLRFKSPTRSQPRDLASSYSRSISVDVRTGLSLPIATGTPAARKSPSGWTSIAPTAPRRQPHTRLPRNGPATGSRAGARSYVDVNRVAGRRRSHHCRRSAGRRHWEQGAGRLPLGRGHGGLARLLPRPGGRARPQHAHGLQQGPDLLDCRHDTPYLDDRGSGGKVRKPTRSPRFADTAGGARTHPLSRGW